VKLRAPTLDDLPALTEFFGALEHADGAGASEAELQDWLSSPMFDPAQDFRIALHDGRVVGWCDVWDQSRTHQRFFLDVRVHPPEPRTYARLLDWGLERAGAVAVDDAISRAWGDSRDEIFAHEMKRRGFKLVRHFFRMEIDLTKEPEAPNWPEGVTVRTFRPGEERAVYNVNTETFADHWDFVPLAFEEWEEIFLHSSGFDPTLWFIAEDGDEIAGYSLCHAERRPRTGHVNILGVRPPWRRCGLGRALLLHSFRELRARGRTKADLGVDAENTTGAVRLYEGVGMYVARRMDSYEKALA
jgi:mycothiol synthase